MEFTQRIAQSETDQQHMVALAQRFWTHTLHVVDLPYRFSSWVMDNPLNTCLWFDQNQELAAWAVMQTPFWCIDYAYQPDIGAHLHQQILLWAGSRAQKIVKTPYGHPAWFINVFTDQHSRIQDLKAAGFASQKDAGDDAWSKVLMQWFPTLPKVEAALPTGFILRPLKGKEEVVTYLNIHQTTFESKNMTEPWRRRVLYQQDYNPDLDLVVESPDGHLAAFCICWIKPAGAQRVGQIEPLGVHPNYRRLGLGSAILHEALMRLIHHGAEKIFVETDAYRNAALELYESAGFRVQREVLVFRKDFSRGSA